MTPNQFINVFVEEDRFTDWMYSREEALEEARRILAAQAGVEGGEV